MTATHRKHVLLPQEAVGILEAYQNKYGLRSFSGAVEAAAQALARQERQRAYQDYAREYGADAQAQREAESWLGAPMEEA